MRRLLRWFLLVLIGGAGALGMALLVVYFIVGTRINKVYAIPAEEVPVRAEPQAVQRGRQLVSFVRCVECHGGDLGGRTFLEAPLVGRLAASNLTPGRGGVGAAFRIEDWVRALRYGVGPDGKSLLVTPAQFYHSLSDEDLGAIIAYLQTLPPVDRELPDSTLGPLGRLYVLLFDPPEWLPAEKIERLPPPFQPAPAATAGYGGYLVRITACGACHGRGVSSLEQSAEGWSKDAFLRFMRTGVNPGGQGVSNDFMPWENTRFMSDMELEAMWLFIRSQQAAGGP